MLFFEFECSPLPGSAAADRYGGAFATCWIDSGDQSEAEVQARGFLEGEGWRVETVEEAYVIARSVYDDGHSPEGLERFDRAVQDGDCYQIHTYPVGGRDDDTG